MTKYLKTNRLKVADDTISTMQQAGYDLSAEDVTFVWRAATGQASQEELDQWTCQMAAKLLDKPVDRGFYLALQEKTLQLKPDLSSLADTVMSVSGKSSMDGADDPLTPS